MLKVYLKTPYKVVTYNQIKAKEGSNLKMYQAENNLELATGYRYKMLKSQINLSSELQESPELSQQKKSFKKPKHNLQLIKMSRNHHVHDQSLILSNPSLQPPDTERSVISEAAGLPRDQVKDLEKEFKSKFL